MTLPAPLRIVGRRRRFEAEILTKIPRFGDQLLDLRVGDHNATIGDLVGRANLLARDPPADLAGLPGLDAMERHAPVHESLDVLDHLGVMGFVLSDRQISFTEPHRGLRSR